MPPLLIPVHPADILGANQRRGHWGARHGRTRVLRELAAVLAHQAYRQNLLERHECADIVVTVHPPDRRRRDAHNTLPSIKACIDGLVDAGILPDDSDKHLRSLTIQGRDVHTPGRWVFAFDVTPVTEAVGDG